MLTGEHCLLEVLGMAVTARRFPPWTVEGTLIGRVRVGRHLRSIQAGARLRWRPGRRPCPRDFLITATNGSVTLRVQVSGLSADAAGNSRGWRQLRSSHSRGKTHAQIARRSDLRRGRWHCCRGRSGTSKCRLRRQALLLAAPSRIVRLAIIRRRRPPTTDRRRRLMPIEEDSAGKCAKHAFTRKN
jgi:hypothetical protein